MKTERISIRPIENGYVVEISIEKPKSDDKWDSDEKEFYCANITGVTAKVSEYLK